VVAQITAPSWFLIFVLIVAVIGLLIIGET
jgi:hypothetical protein